MILPAETRESLRTPAKHRINTKASESTVLPAVEKDPFGKQLFVHRVSCHGQERPSWISSHPSWHIRVERIACGVMWTLPRTLYTAPFRLRSAFESHTQIRYLSLTGDVWNWKTDRGKSFRFSDSLSLSRLLISRCHTGILTYILRYIVRGILFFVKHSM